MGTTPVRIIALRALAWVAALGLLGVLVACAGSLGAAAGESNAAAGATAGGGAAGGLSAAGTAATARQPEDSALARTALQSSFVARGAVGLDRLQQDDVQRLCSEAEVTGQPVSAAVAEQIERAAAAQVSWPSAQFLATGDWQRGERVAQSGVGRQWSDPPEAPAGGNCYACHQLSARELAYGTIGPSLLGYGRLREQLPRGELERLVYAKIYNPQSSRACSAMPRFGAHGILTQEQIRDLVALLVDPASPVNQR